jgi:hypothetical protein
MHYKSEDIDLSQVLLPSATLRPGAAVRCMEKQVGPKFLPISPTSCGKVSLRCVVLWRSHDSNFATSLITDG